MVSRDLSGKEDIKSKELGSLEKHTFTDEVELVAADVIHSGNAFSSYYANINRIITIF